LQVSVPRVECKGDVDVSDVDNYASLSPIEKVYILLDQVREEYGYVDPDKVCLAELHTMYWAMTRRRRIAAIHQARSMKKDHSLTSDKTGDTLAKRGLRDVEAARSWFAKCGIPVMDAIV